MIGDTREKVFAALAETAGDGAGDGAPGIVRAPVRAHVGVMRVSFISRWRGCCWLFVAAGVCGIVGGTSAGAETAKAGAAAESAPWRVMTFNIRYAEPRDGANAWPRRRDAVAGLIGRECDVGGLQEVLAGQLEDLRARLPEFAFVSRGRERDPAKGEACPVIYRRARFEEIASGTFWLSDTLDEPGSRHWGNTLPRICTWAELRDRGDGSVLRLYNLHLDNASAESRRRSVEAILARVEARASTSPEPAPGTEATPPVTTILLGDFNEPPDGPALTRLRAAGGWRDAWAERGSEAEAGATAEAGGGTAPAGDGGDSGEEGGTFNGWRPSGPYPRIDYLFVRGAADGASGAVPSRVRVARERVGETGGWVSDHFPVLMELVRSGR